MKRLVLLAMPLMTISLLANCANKNKDEYYTVTFESDGGTEVVPQTIKANDHAIKPTDPSKRPTFEQTFTFAGWFEVIDGVVEEKQFSFDTTPIVKDTFLRAKWDCVTRQYMVTFDSNGGTPVNPVFVDYNKTIKEPTKPSKEDDVRKYIFDGWYKDGETTKFDFDHTKIQSNITLYAHWTNGESKKYNITATDSEHLKFSFKQQSSNGFTKEVEAGLPFSFKMIVDQVNQNDTGYKLPTVLDIKVKESEVPIDSGYEIIEDSSTVATVTIKQGIIIGDVTINGEAVKSDLYKVDLQRFGVNDDFSGGYADCTEDLAITFTKTPQFDYKLPTAENIYLKIDDAQEWITPKDPLTKDCCVFDEKEHKLTLLKNVVKSYVSIRVRAPDYPILNNLTWKQISDYSTWGYAPSLFYIGDKKEGVMINGLAHSVRIIGFNHDPLNSDRTRTAGITFEFADLISANSVGAIRTTFWGERRSNNYNAYFTTLNETLNGSPTDGKDESIYNLLPDDLKSEIKVVGKHFAADDDRYAPQRYPVKLFSLSQFEMSEEEEKYVPHTEGKTYQYYKEHKNPEDRIKRDISGEEHPCWLRSPHTDPSKIKYAWVINIIGKFNWGIIDFNTLGLSPAFCI